MSHDARVSCLAAGLLASVLAGCASAPAVEPKTSVRLEPLRSSAPAESTAPLPKLPELSSAPTLSEGSAPRLQTLEATDQEIGVVVRMLATRFGLQYYIDPNVRGTVSARLRNTTLTEALNAIMPPGVTYEIRNGVLRVAPAQMATKIFTLDYVALSRIGTASTVIQRRLGNNAIGGNGGASQSGGSFGGGGLGGSGAGADVISAVSIANAWDEIRVSVEALIFDSTAATGAMDAGSGFAGGAGGAGARPFSRTSRDGRRVIINPMSGTITVSAMPRQLDQVEFFIKTFESSIQRQVLIEAKIVEVNLDQEFEFGIDWNVVGRGGTTGLAVRSNPSSTASRGNVEFTLSGGAGQISVILNALSSQGNVRVLSSPRVSALNNQRAVFDVTTGEIVFNMTQTPVFGPNGIPVSTQTQVTPQQINVGIVLDVLPQIGADNTVTMNIRPVVTSVRSTAQFRTPEGSVVTAPVIDTRESDTMARLRAGETIIIGGLMQTRSEKVKSGVPGLRSLPLLGRLFTTYHNVERKAELVIFLTPTIIAGQPPATR